ncbi:MAG TPA: hypothetical protein VGU21_07130 [Streptosporangiaceae bacterium]|nr:hypothetical protein [Streptosporangiaceae bacterium]
MELFGGGVINHARQAYFYGYAQENVRRVVPRSSSPAASCWV